ncbi:MAG: cupin [Gammaproteobacteria bacterium]|nr:cupin [Gammaproteobacteria bacterium]
MVDTARDAEVTVALIGPTDGLLNNQTLPLLIYHAVLMPALAEGFESRFTEHGWPGGWRNGIFSFHHFHSNAHEVLGVYHGTSNVQFGGDTGPIFTVTAGDVIIIPAGVAHNKVDANPLSVVGSYPAGQTPDTCRPHDKESTKVSHAPMPKSDPFFGVGPLQEHWHV